MGRAKWIGGRRYSWRVFKPRAKCCNEMPSFRGGGVDKSSKLLEGLTKLLSSFESVEEEDSFDTEADQALLVELQRLISRKPRNLLQELKSLVSRFTRLPEKPKPAKKTDWATVVRGGPKPKAQKQVSAMHMQLPGRLRAEDWQVKIATTPNETETLLQTEKRLVLAPARCESAPEMWALLGSGPRSQSYTGDP